MTKFNRLVDVAKIFKLTKQTGRSFHVAFVLKGRKVIEVGFNNFTKSNRICHYYKPTRHHMADYRGNIHAEINSATKSRYRKDIKNLTLVSIRVNNNNKIAFAQPCPNCAFHLGKWGFKNIFYSTNDETFERLDKCKHLSIPEQS